MMIIIGRISSMAAAVSGKVLVQLFKSLFRRSMKVLDGSMIFAVIVNCCKGLEINGLFLLTFPMECITLLPNNGKQRRCFLR